jgi:hypothetical protein
VDSPQYSADCPKRAPEHPVAHLENWTVRRLIADRLPRTDRLYSTHGLSAKPTSTETEKLNRSNQELARTSDELDEQKATRTVGACLGRCSMALLLKVNTIFPLPDLPKHLRDFYQIIGEDEVSLGDAIPTNMYPQTH